MDLSEFSDVVFLLFFKLDFGVSEADTDISWLV